MAGWIRIRMRIKELRIWDFEIRKAGAKRKSLPGRRPSLLGPGEGVWGPRRKTFTAEALRAQRDDGGGGQAVAGQLTGGKICGKFPPWQG